MKNKNTQKQATVVLGTLILSLLMGMGVNFATAQEKYGILEQLRESKAKRLQEQQGQINTPETTDEEIRDGFFPAINIGPDVQSKRGPLVVNRQGLMPFGFLVPFGNVGIGTTDFKQATSKLVLRDSSGGAIGQMNFDAKVTNPYTALFKLDDVGLKIGHGSTIRNIQFLTGNALNQPSPRLTIAPNGRIGIGTADPAALLHVTEQVRFSGLDLPPPTQVKTVFADAEGDLTAGSYTFNGTVSVPLNQQWSDWRNVGFTPSSVAFSGLQNPDKNCVVPPTFSLPAGDGVASAWAYTACNGVDRIQIMSVEKQGQHIRVKFAWNDTEADLAFTAFR